MIFSKIIKDISNAIKDPNRDLTDRLFLRLNIISEIVVFVAFIIDLIMKENKGEIITLVLTLIFVPIISFSSMYKNRIKFATRLIVTCLIFLILPALFFFGGGLEGGGVLWIIYAFLYVGLVLSGTWRNFFFLMLFVLGAFFYAVEYNYPELVFEHSREMFFVDSFVSLILIGIVGYFMTRAQNNFYMEENERAKKEKERAEELTLSQNRFFSSMSHEIRTPINSILGLNELILRDVDASNDIVKDAMGIQGSGKMLLSLINDLLDFSKMEAGSMDIVAVDYNVGNMISEIVNMIWLRANEKGLKFNVTIDPTVPSVLYGDEVRIKQILVNLLNNAVKYTQSGSVELHIECSEEGEKDAILSISVIDTGMGIKKESLPYLFDAFKRVDEANNRYIEGTGLGLSIVKQLVELMGGTISVNSVYGEGSTFTVVIKQGISDKTKIGELNIHNKKIAKREVYECSFKAPEARVLIVDDNEMNLEVESRLLADTELVIDKAMSGRDALALTLKYKYDAILMDHLMPEMDGIETLSYVRNQMGGLNRSTPIVVLTANAGSDNRDLYSRAGFDGYLVKPVSGEELEKMLIKNISPDKLILSTKVVGMHEDINAASGYSGKMPVAIASTSMCDLPDEIVQKLKIPILPFLIHTDEGVFKDGVQMDSDELIRYMHSGRDAISSPPDETAYTEFFAKILKNAHHVIYISISTSMSTDYNRALDAAKSFENVTVINSDCLSSATGILVLIAHKLAQQSLSVSDIVEELETVKTRLKCSFVIDRTDFMFRRGLVSSRVHTIADALNLHPSLRFKDGQFGVGGVWIGKTKRAYKQYIKSAFPVDVIPDPGVLFITYVDVPWETLYKIREEVSRYAYFEHVVFKQASAAISSNCGSGTVGVLYFVKSNKSYNLGSYIHESDDEDNDQDNVEEMITGKELETQIDYEIEMAEDFEEQSDGQVTSQLPWYQTIKGIDGDAAIQNSGSEASFETVLKIFYDTIPAKSSEINDYYSSNDWENYTIKVHALKSSSRLIGALELGDRAQLLENAGKENDIDYIKEHHDSFMEDYMKYREYIGAVFGGDNESKTYIDAALLTAAYEGIREAADNMDCAALEDIIYELSEYAIYDDEIERFNAIKDKIDNLDYDGIMDILKDM